MQVQLSDEARRFLEAPNLAVMATTAKDGRPVAVATWYLLEPSGLILFSVTPDRVRLAHIRRDPRIALDVVHPRYWLPHASLQLTVESITDDPDFAALDAVSWHYSGLESTARAYAGRPFPDHEGSRIAVRASIDRIYIDGDLPAE